MLQPLKWFFFLLQTPSSLPVSFLCIITGPSISDVSSPVLSSEKFYLPHPPGDVLHKTTQEVLSLLHHTLHTHVQLAVYQEPQDIFGKAALQSWQYVLVHGAIPPQIQDSERQQAPVSLFLEPTELPLRNKFMTSFNNHSSQLCTICKAAKDSLSAIGWNEGYSFWLHH